MLLVAFVGLLVIALIRATLWWEDNRHLRKVCRVVGTGVDLIVRVSCVCIAQGAPPYGLWPGLPAAPFFHRGRGCRGEQVRRGSR